MAIQFGTHLHHSDTIFCPKCGKKGVITWDDVSRADGDGKDFVGIEGGFHERLSRKAPYAIEMVCDGCGTAQAE